WIWPRAWARRPCRETGGNVHARGTPMAMPAAAPVDTAVVDTAAWIRPPGIRPPGIRPPGIRPPWIRPPWIRPRGCSHAAERIHSAAMDIPGADDETLMQAY